MTNESPFYKPALNAACRFAEHYGLWELCDQLAVFGVGRTGELDERQAIPFIARVWVGPRLRRVK